MKIKIKKVYGVLGWLIFIFVWTIVSSLGIINSFFLPSFKETISELFRLLISGAILPDIYSTIIRVSIAFAIAVCVGIPLGLLLGSSRKIYEIFEPLIDFFRSIPPITLFPLFLLIFGISDKSKIIVAAIASILTIVFNTAYGVIHSKKTRTDAARLMGASKFQIFKNITFWETLPQTIVGVRTAVSLSLVLIIVTEMFIGTVSGLGARIIDFQYMYNVKGMYAVIILTGIIGYALNLLFIYLEKKVVHWSGR